jgi:hypothetical protein
MTPGDGFFEVQLGGPDPAEVSAAAELAAQVLVRGARADGDQAVADRVLHLADSEGLETLADLWSGAPADSLAGCLWRLYLLRTWVHTDPVEAARQFDAGRSRAAVAGVIAGVAEPPGPEDLKVMADHVLRGIVQGDFADVLFRASAFARVIAAGRAETEETSAAAASRMQHLADDLESAARQELSTGLA